MMWCSGGKRRQKGKEGRTIMIILRSRVVKNSVHCSILTKFVGLWSCFCFFFFFILFMYMLFCPGRGEVDKRIKTFTIST